MKNINERFTDEEHLFLTKFKRKFEANSWHDFILMMAYGYEEEEAENN